MIKIDGNNVFIDIEVIGQDTLKGHKFDSSFVVNKGIEVLAFREVYTAGFALPTYELIMLSTDEDYLNSFNEQNTIKISIGTEVNDISTYTCDTIGKGVVKDATGDRFLLNWGGVLSKNKLNSRFLKHVDNAVYRGNALEALLKVWKDETGCDVDNQIKKLDVGLTRDWRRTRETLNNYLVDIYMHMDLKPSFPLATIDGTGRLLLRDFQTMKERGVSTTFYPEGTSLRAGRIGYSGGVSVNSFKTYSNRYCGYVQKSGRDIKTGKIYTVGNSVQDITSGWGLNTLATTKANENNPMEHQSSESPNVLISDTTPIAYHETEIFNKTQLVNMSSIQAKIAIDSTYMSQVRVLDLVQLDTGKPNDINNGKYIVEAIEKGFVGKGAYRAVVYMCRDNHNDVEQHQADTYSKLGVKALKIDPKTRANLVNSIRSSRRSLIHMRGFMDNTYINNFEQHLISMKRGAMSNFNMYNTRIDFNDLDRTTSSLRNAGSNLVNMVINKYVKQPYSTMLFNTIFNNSTMMGLFMGLMSGVIGGDLYGEFTSLMSDLNSFDVFLNNYQKTTSYARTLSSPTYVEEVTSGTITFREAPSGEVVAYEITEVDNNMTYTVEEKAKMVTQIMTQVSSRIPESVDIPLPEVTLTDSEAIQPTEKVEETVINKVVESLVEQGYVYDSEIIDVEEGSGSGSSSSGGSSDVPVVKTFMKPDGTVITAEEARETVVPSETMKQILKGTVPFDSTSANKIKRTVGTDLYVRHWGTFTSDEELSSFNINKGFVEKYRTLNTTKAISARGGKRIYMALPAFEKGVTFYINSIRTELLQTEYDDLGYRDSRGFAIPYIIYYTNDYYNSTNLTLEIRRKSVN